MNKKSKLRLVEKSPFGFYYVWTVRRTKEGTFYANEIPKMYTLSEAKALGIDKLIFCKGGKK